MVGVNARNCYFDLQLDIQKESVRSEKRERDSTTHKKIK